MTNVDQIKKQQEDTANVSNSTDDKDVNKLTDQTLNEQENNESNELVNQQLTAKLDDINLNSDNESNNENVVNESVNEQISVLSNNSNELIINKEDELNNSQLNESNHDSNSQEEENNEEEEENLNNLQNQLEPEQEQQEQQEQQQQESTNFKVTNLDQLLSSTLTDNNLSDEIKLNVLCSKIVALASDNTIDVQPFADSILKLLIREEMQKINSCECMQIFFANYIRHLPKKLLAEILSVLIAVFKKSLLNVESAKGILLDCLNLYVEESQKNLSANENLIKHFLKEIIGQLCNYSCNVKELKTLIKISEDDPQLLALIRQANLHQRGRPNSFFNFSGSKGSLLALAPLHKMPTQNGWTFITWFRIEPNSINSQPYLFYLRSSKSNVGYSAHFTGNCLVLTSMKVKGKGMYFTFYNLKLKAEILLLLI